MAKFDRVLVGSDELCSATVIELLASGGDDRIRIGPDGRNRYFATATPFTGLAYGSSTISSIGADALDHLVRHWYPLVAGSMDSRAYAQHLVDIRARLVAHYAHADTAVVIAASGTDLEYVGLAAAPAGAGPIFAILLGRDEVGSGCIHSAAGRFFADTTASGAAVASGTPIDTRHAANRLADVAIRHADGHPRASAEIRAEIEGLADAALALGEHPVIHIVHGSKTGLTLPSMTDCAALADRYGPLATLVVDACQLRISPAAVRAYLAMGAVVLGTGSKFAGGAPFSGFAFVPAAIMHRAAPLSPGFARLSRRAEWPAQWPGRDILPDGANPGMLLRLAGALFEIDRFLSLPEPRVAEIVADFRAAANKAATTHGMALLPGSDGRTCLAASLVTLDLSHHHRHLDFDTAASIHRRLCLAATAAAVPMRIGQPVRARRLSKGRFAGTLRIALSMPMVVDLARTADASAARLERELVQICAAIAAEYSEHHPLQSAA